MAIDPATNTLIDAKNYTDWPIDKDFSTKSVLEQAKGQVKVAESTGASVEWRVATQAKADVLRGLFKENDVPIKVIVETPKGP